MWDSDLWYYGNEWCTRQDSNLWLLPSEGYLLRLLDAGLSGITRDEVLDILLKTQKLESSWSLFQPPLH